MKKLGRMLALLCALAPLPAAHAIALADLRAEDLMQQAPDLKKSLNLNPNQTLLWQQSEAKARTILRTRQLRREKMQAGMKPALQDSKTELRELLPKIEAEDDTTRSEDKQLRELFLTMNDALDDAQRQTVLGFLSDQLLRVPFAEKESHPARGTSEKGSEGRGRGGHRGGAGL